MGFLKDIVIGAISPIAGVFKSSNENKTKVKLSQIERIKNADDALAEWELIQAENARSSWKDEYWTIILSIPLCLAFFPEYRIFIEDGFSALSDMPDFYQYWLGVCVLASFGVKFSRK